MREWTPAAGGVCRGAALETAVTVDLDPGRRDAIGILRSQGPARNPCILRRPALEHHCIVAADREPHS